MLLKFTELTEDDGKKFVKLFVIVFVVAIVF